MKPFFYYLLLAVVFALIGWFGHIAYSLPRESNPLAEIRPTPLAKYSIENLANANIAPANIQIAEKLTQKPKFTSHEFSFTFDPALNGKESKKVSGLINIPVGDGHYPIVVLFRGYVDPAIYYTGMGTLRVGEFFAENGFITIAPDFLGYGASDKEASDIFESRFQTFTTAMETLKSVSTIDKWDKKNLFIWGHSNGGQIGLTTLEITGASYPTVLWAPVSKPFPYSILYYTDDASDSGKFLRKETAEFENNYNSSQYSLTNYLNRIKAPVQLNQGTGDDAVPAVWSDLLNKNLKANGVDISYIKYLGADHNLNPSWDRAITNALDFYRKFMK